MDSIDDKEGVGLNKSIKNVITKERQGKIENDDVGLV